MAAASRPPTSRPPPRRDHRVTAIHVVLYALLAAASALAITAVIVVLRTSRPRINGIAFAIGFVVGQLAVCVFALAIGIGTVPERDHAHDTFQAALEVLVGAGLLVGAWRVRYQRPRPDSLPTGRIREEIATRRAAAVARLGSLRPGAMAGSGALLGIGGPKRLTLTLLAVATIATGGLATTTEVSLVAVYVAIATALVWVPLGLTLVFGGRAAEWTAAAHEWWTRHRTIAILVPLVVLGAYFVGVGIVDLLGD